MLIVEQIGEIVFHASLASNTREAGTVSNPIIREAIVFFKRDLFCKIRICHVFYMPPAQRVLKDQQPIRDSYQYLVKSMILGQDILIMLR